MVTLIVYFISSPGESNYNYFSRLSNSFIHGKLYLTENPSWLNELVPVGDKYYVVYPPMPAILMMPVAIFAGSNAPQTLFSIFLGAINAVLVFVMIKRLKFSNKTAFLITATFAFGTNHWYLASVGSAWYIEHVVALFFMLLALIETFGKQRLILIGFLLGGAFWARTTVLFTIPFFYIYLHKRFWPINKLAVLDFLKLHLGVFSFLGIDGLYNYLRFGDASPLSSYSRIPNLDRDPVFKNGFMSLSFIPRHFQAAFQKIPKFQTNFPFLIPSYYSDALWFLTPVFIYLLRFRKKLIVIASWVGVLLTFFVISLWAGVGYAQFGYRFAQDFMPLLLILLAFGIGQKPAKLVYILVILSILINGWEMFVLNKLQLYIM